MPGHGTAHNNQSLEMLSQQAPYDRILIVFHICRNLQVISILSYLTQISYYFVEAVVRGEISTSPHAIWGRWIKAADEPSVYT